MNAIPRIKSVTPLQGAILQIVFVNGVTKEYDCSSLFIRPEFRMLKNEAFFKMVHVDTGGYGISWNADIDLSEYELWTSGKELSDAA